MVQNFLTHEDECSRTTSEALRLACSHANENADITQYNALLGRIGKLWLEITYLGSAHAQFRDDAARRSAARGRRS